MNFEINFEILYVRGDILIHNMSTGKQVGTLSTVEKHAVRVLQFSPFKASVLGAGYDDGTIRVWDVFEQRILAEFNRAVSYQI